MKAGPLVVQGDWYNATLEAERATMGIGFPTPENCAKGKLQSSPKTKNK
jgi:hypothetical protein